MTHLKIVYTLYICSSVEWISAEQFYTTAGRCSATYVYWNLPLDTVLSHFKLIHLVTTN